MNNPYPCDLTSDMPTQMPGSSSPAQCSAASLKAEIGALREKRSKFWWHDRPNNGDLLEVLVLLDKLAVVTERIEKQLPPNSDLSNSGEDPKR